ncbi:hypothetical protein NPIL_698291 [Nephila pilipes]|uniref:Uncharacterized protein n=1 Tax=Nephila pilipes TaxID=299642 RepID=A0A8X6IZL6_NEPPI|nr:hypothetical protein NPIL_698291 [Nephila pilipes]
MNTKSTGRTEIVLFSGTLSKSGGNQKKNIKRKQKKKAKSKHEEEVGKAFIYFVPLSLVRSLIFSSRSPNCRAFSATLYRGLDWLVGREGKLAWFFGGRRQRPSAEGLGNDLNGTSSHKLGTSPSENLFINRCSGFDSFSSIQSLAHVPNRGTCLNENYRSSTL